MAGAGPGRWFDDFSVGQCFDTEGYTFTESSIIDFALQYDPQYFHLDRERAAHSIYGGLVASGFHTLAVVFRLIVQARIFWPGNLGGKGMDELRWRRAVRPGDTIHAIAAVAETRPSRSRPDRGYVRMVYDVRNQRDEPVLSFEIVHILMRGPPAA